MIEKVLSADREKFKNNLFIHTKRPTWYWMLFFKKNVFIAQKKSFQFRYLLFLIPVVTLLVTALVTDSSDIEDAFLVVLFISLFITIIAFSVSSQLIKHAFIHLNVFGHLVKFIIDIKGDIFRDIINLKLNLNPIERKVNLINPKTIGLRSYKGLKCKPYHIERYKGRFALKDGSLCQISLNQISIKIITTKKRSSGKVKTKFKYKHKFLSTLSLKLNSSDFKLGSKDKFGKNHTYNVKYTEFNSYYIIKAKHKEKVTFIDSNPKRSGTFGHSNFTLMLDYLKKQKLISKKD